jgi:DNA-binding NtrC family response regulator
MSLEEFKILITDDDIDLRELLIEAVRNWDYAADVAKDGDEALRKLKMERFDLVVCDLMMPGMDGLTLLKKIKELDKDILVIIITGYATIETAVKAIEAGAYDYIAKPFRLDELMIVIKNACERLRLTSQNKALLEELREAYREIAELKGGGGDPAGDGGKEGRGVRGEVTGGAESKGPLKQKEYLKEAESPLTIKPLPKSGG